MALAFRSPEGQFFKSLALVLTAKNNSLALGLKLRPFALKVKSLALKLKSLALYPSPCSHHCFRRITLIISAREQICPKVLFPRARESGRAFA